VEGELLEKLAYARKQWLRYLKKDSHLFSELDNGRLHYSNGDVLNLLLYGGRAHLDDAFRRERYESWQSNAGGRAILETRLLDILDYLHVGITVLRDLHLKVVQQYAGESTATV
jgi:hypothetical protein